MTATYTPSLEDAREALMFAGWTDGHVDRFIAQVRAEALREAAEDFKNYRESGAPIGTPSERWLRARADRIEREGS